MDASSPVIEAKGLFALTRNGESADKIRSLIGMATPYRRRVRLCFDCLAARHPHRKRPEISRELRVLVVSLLKTNSLTAVHHKLHLPHNVVRRISKEDHAPLFKVGRGRKITPEMRDKMAAELRADARPVDVKRKFRVSLDYVLKLRHTLGIFENRRHRRGWDENKVREGLREGRLTISEIENKFAIGHQVLWKLRHRLGDCEDRRHRKRMISEEQRATILKDSKTMTQHALSQKYHMHTSRIRAFQIEAGIARPTCRRLTPDEVLKLEDLLKTEMTNKEIAREFGITRGAIWQRRKRCDENGLI